MTLKRQFEIELERNEAILESLGYQLMDNLTSSKFQDIYKMHVKYEKIVDELREKVKDIIDNPNKSWENQ